MLVVTGMKSGQRTIERNVTLLEVEKGPFSGIGRLETDH